MHVVADFMFAMCIRQRSFCRHVSCLLVDKLCMCGVLEAQEVLTSVSMLLATPKCGSLCFEIARGCAGFWECYQYMCFCVHASANSQQSSRRRRFYCFTFFGCYFLCCTCCCWIQLPGAERDCRVVQGFMPQGTSLYLVRDNQVRFSFAFKHSSCQLWWTHRAVGCTGNKCS